MDCEIELEESVFQKFFNVLRNNSTSISQRFNTFIQTYGNPSNDDVYWIIHEFYAEPSDMEQFLKLTQKLDDETKDTFPGQFGVSQVMFGGSPDVSHLLTVGYSSIAELEGWEDQVATNPALQKYFKMADRRIDRCREWIHFYLSQAILTFSL